MLIPLGSLCFGMVLGWLMVCLAQRSLPGWREFKVTLAVLLGAAVRSTSGDYAGLLTYGIGLVIGASLYGVTWLIEPLRRAHMRLSIQGGDEKRWRLH